MRMLVSGVVLGIAGGLAIGHNWRPLAAISVRWLPLLIVALISRACAPFVPGLGLPLYVFALTGTVVVAAANYRLVGALIVALGGALNLAVVLMNGGMPVDPSAVAAAGGVMPRDSLHVALDAATLLRPFADVIPVAAFHGAYSVGDVGIALGGFLVPFVLLSRR